MRKFALIAAGAGMLVLSLAVMNLTQGLQTADAEAGAVALVAIDTTTDGNDDTALGTIDACASISVDETLVFDLVVQGVDNADRIAGYQVDIDYDATVISVDSVVDIDAAGSTAPNNVSIISRIESSGGLGFQGFSDLTTPDSMQLSAIDATQTPTYPDMHESGEGVLARVTITGLANGTSPLDIGGTIGGSDGFVDATINSGADGLGDPVPVTTVQDGEIVVGGDCVAATDTPTPTDVPTTTDTPTPTDVPTTTDTPTPTDVPTATATTGPTATATTAPTATATATPTAAPTAGTATPGSLPPTGGDTGSSGPATVWLLALSALGLALIAASWGAIRASRRELS